MEMEWWCWMWLVFLLALTGSEWPSAHGSGIGVAPSQQSCRGKAGFGHPQGAPSLALSALNDLQRAMMGTHSFPKGLSHPLLHH